MFKIEDNTVLRFTSCCCPLQDLATAGTTKRPTCCVLVLTKPTKGELSEEVKEKLKSDYDQVVTEVAEATSAMF
jgi:H/ACA ribonucleoprotein complex subunit 2